MIDIVDEAGHVYKFDEETGRIFRDDVLIPGYKVEPVYSDCSNRNNPPIFSGIHFVQEGRILTRAGNFHVVSDENSVL